MLTNQISNLILTITLAKADIINPSIFNHGNLRSILNELPVEVLISSLTEAYEIRILNPENIVHKLVAYLKLI